jgi:hypothetical protein
LEASKFKDDVFSMFSSALPILGIQAFHAHRVSRPFGGITTWLGGKGIQR